MYLRYLNLPKIPSRRYIKMQNAPLTNIGNPEIVFVDREIYDRLQFTRSLASRTPVTFHELPVRIEFFDGQVTLIGHVQRMVIHLEKQGIIENHITAVADPADRILCYSDKRTGSLVPCWPHPPQHEAGQNDQQ